MGLLWRKEQFIIHKIEAYLEQVDKCQELFRSSMEELINSGGNEAREESVAMVHRAEARADDLRREIELELYQKALIPESRGDVLGIIETIDRIPGLFESLCFQMSLQRIEIPKEFRERYLKLIDVNIDSYKLLREAVLGFFYKRDVHNQLRETDQKESESDRIERALIRDIFTTSLDKADKILLKEIVVNTGDISDFVEIAADRLTLALIKRRI
ncbi:hypothetical protein ES703_99452 [subsurface metagenome]